METTRPHKNEDGEGPPAKKPRFSEPTAATSPVACPSRTGITVVVIGGADPQTSISVRLPHGDPSSASDALGGFLWPSAFYLASYLHQPSARFTHRTTTTSGGTTRRATVLELGAGRCLTGVHLALLPDGPRVILTDAATHFVSEAHATLALNHVSPARATVRRLAWGEFPASTLSLKDEVDYVIGADVFYEAADFASVFATVSYLGRPFLTSYQHRGGDARRRLERLARKWRIEMETIPFDVPADGDSAESEPATSRPTLELLLFTPNR